METATFVENANAVPGVQKCWWLTDALILQYVIFQYNTIFHKKNCIRAPQILNDFIYDVAVVQKQMSHRWQNAEYSLLWWSEEN